MYVTQDTSLCNAVTTVELVDSELVMFKAKMTVYGVIGSDVITNLYHIQDKFVTKMQDGRHDSHSHWNCQQL